ncbi:MAG: hypothetical protein ACR2GH_18125 [Pseudonocardia sp.]
MLSLTAIQATTVSSDFNEYSYLVASLALASLLGLIVKKRISINFMILYGLLAIAFLATIIIFANINEAALTSVFTLLGTIAGYLAGVRTPPKHIEDGSGGSTTSTKE